MVANAPAPVPSTLANSAPKPPRDTQLSPAALVPKGVAVPDQKTTDGFPTKPATASKKPGVSGRPRVAVSSLTVEGGKEKQAEEGEIAEDAEADEDGEGAEDIDLEEEEEGEEDEEDEGEKHPGRSRSQAPTNARGLTRTHNLKPLVISEDDRSASDVASLKVKGRGRKKAVNSDAEEHEVHLGKHKAKGRGKRRAALSNDEDGEPAPPPRTGTRKKAGPTKARAPAVWVVRGVRYYSDRPAEQALKMLQRGNTLDLFTLFQQPEMHGMHLVDLAEYSVSRAVYSQAYI